jgi:hypothetical protein
VLSYFDSVHKNKAYSKFATDDMLQENFNEIVDKGIIEVRLVGKLKHDNYCEVVFEDGKLYVQAMLEKYGSNIDIKDAASKIISQEKAIVAVLYDFVLGDDYGNGCSMKGMDGGVSRSRGFF